MKGLELRRVRDSFRIAVEVYLIPAALTIGGVLALVVGIVVGSRTAVVCGAAVAGLGALIAPEYLAEHRRRASQDQDPKQ